mgnify:CR=1 FL=1
MKKKTLSDDIVQFLAISVATYCAATLVDSVLRSNGLESRAQNNSELSAKRYNLDDLQRNDGNYVVKNQSGNYVSVSEYLQR